MNCFLMLASVSMDDECDCEESKCENECSEAHIHTFRILVIIKFLIDEHFVSKEIASWSLKNGRRNIGSDLFILA